MERGHVCQKRHDVIREERGRCRGHPVLSDVRREEREGPRFGVCDLSSLSAVSRQAGRHLGLASIHLLEAKHLLCSGQICMGFCQTLATGLKSEFDLF